MRPEQLKAKFPHASESFLRRNAAEVVDEHSSGGAPLNAPASRPAVTTDEDKLNKTEKRWLAELRYRDIYVFIGIHTHTLKLAHDCRYTPDFFTVTGQLNIRTFWEVKGAHIWEDSLIKLRTAARLFSFDEFRLVQWKDGQWTESLIKP